MYFDATKQALRVLLSNSTLRFSRSVRRFRLLLGPRWLHHRGSLGKNGSLLERVKGYRPNPDSIAANASLALPSRFARLILRAAPAKNIEIKATVLAELYVSLNNARSLMVVPRPSEILALCISKCVGRHPHPHDVCANGKKTLDHSDYTSFIADESN